MKNTDAKRIISEIIKWLEETYGEVEEFNDFVTDETTYEEVKRDFFRWIANI